MSKFTFRESAKVKDEIVMEQAKQIRKMYEESLKEVQDKINLLTAKQKAGNKAIQLKQLEKELVKSYSGISERIETAIKNNSNIVLNAIVNDAKNLAGKIGFTASAAYAKVPEKVIEKIVTGQIYQEGWTLSKALWKDEQLMRQDIQNIVAKGIAGNKSTLEIAKILEQYVDPKAAKPWDWGKVYPGSKQKIDYNAQRLARTMVNHAYQQSVKEVVKDNPFIEKVRWLSALAIGRTCELCESRHNQLFDKDKVPLDHPNGLCTIAPEVESLDDIAKKAKAWKDAPDGTYPEIDTYAKSLGYKGKIEPAETMKSEHRVIDGKTIVGSSKWDREKFPFEIQSVLDAQGFNGIPRIVNADEFDKILDTTKQPFLSRTYSADSQEVLEAYAEQLRTGEFYVDCSVGGAQYGQGMYSAGAYSDDAIQGALDEMQDYIELNKGRGAEFNRIEKMTLDQSAKIIKYNDIKKEYGEAILKNITEVVGDDKKFNKIASDYINHVGTFDTLNKTEYSAFRKKRRSLEERMYKQNENAFGKLMQQGFYKDEGTKAAEMGYDAINAEGHGKSDSYTVVLNRTKLIIKGE